MRNSPVRGALAAGAVMDLRRMDEWHNWRRGVVAEIRSEFREQFSAIEDHEIDWNAWLPLYLEGCQPQAAVNKAYGRDFLKLGSN